MRDPNFAAFVVASDNVYFNSPEEGESYEDLLRINYICNTPYFTEGVIVNLTPPNFDISLPFNEWVFKVDFSKDLLPGWWNAKEAEIACRAKLPEWFEAHCVKEDVTIESGLHLVMNDSCNINLYGGRCNICNGSSIYINVSGKDGERGECNIYNSYNSKIVINNGGLCNIYNIISSSITLNSGTCHIHGTTSLTTININGGLCIFHNNSSSEVMINGGFCYTYDNSSPRIIMSGKNEHCCVFTFNESVPTIVVNNKGTCETYDYSKPYIIINDKGKCETYDYSIPNIIVNEGGYCLSSGNSSPRITLNEGGCCTTNITSTNPIITINKGGIFKESICGNPTIIYNTGRK